MYEMISSSHCLEGDGKQEKDNKKHSYLLGKQGGNGGSIGMAVD